MVKKQITGAGKIIWQNKTIICWTLSTSFVILVKRDPELKRLISSLTVVGIYGNISPVSGIQTERMPTLKSN